jgi:hypothetical protein
MKFNADKMRKLIEDDVYIERMYNNLINKGKDELKALELVFETCVLDDSETKKAYKAIK